VPSGVRIARSTSGLDRAAERIRISPCRFCNTYSRSFEMPIIAMSKKELDEKPSTSRLHQEYVDFLSSARLGSGGKLIVAKEGTSRATVKNRMLRAAEATGKNIKFRRSPATEVVFQVVE
jgi:hypothetical protein